MCDEKDMPDDQKPVTTTKIESKKYTIYIDDDIEYPFKYREIFQALSEATEKDEVIMHINSGGGFVHSFCQFFYFMTNCKAHIKSVIHMAYSAAACIAFCGDEVEVSPLGSVMIHSMSFGVGGKVSDIQDRTDFETKRDKYHNELLFTGFLTKSEIESINKGKEFWMDKKEIDRRLVNWKPIKQNGVSKKTKISKEVK